MVWIKLRVVRADCRGNYCTLFTSYDRQALPRVNTWAPNPQGKSLCYQSLTVRFHPVLEGSNIYIHNHITRTGDQVTDWKKDIENLYTFSCWPKRPSSPGKNRVYKRPRRKPTTSLLLWNPSDTTHPWGSWRGWHRLTSPVSKRSYRSSFSQQQIWEKLCWNSLQRLSRLRVQNDKPV